MRLATHVFCFGLCIGLSACGMSSPHFYGIAATTVRVDDQLFRVRRKGRLAESVRITPAWAPRLGPVAGQAEIAIEGATGCRITRIAGDAAMQVARLDCPGAPPPPLHPQIVCRAQHSTFSVARGAPEVEIDCFPI